jgi:hypothetical protein
MGVEKGGGVRVGSELVAVVPGVADGGGKVGNETEDVPVWTVKLGKVRGEVGLSS